MPNPNNVVCLYGVVSGEIKYIASQGTDFAMRFHLDVQRTYRNKDGVYETDSIPIRYEFGPSDAMQEFAHSIKAGDVLKLSGTMRTQMFNGSATVFCLADTISFDEATRKKKYAKEKGDELVSAEFCIDLPLPI